MDAFAILILLSNLLCALVIVRALVLLIGYALIRYLKRYRWAAWYYSALLIMLPWSQIIYIHRAWAWLCLKEFDKAIADCDRAIQLKPKTVMAYNYRAWAWIYLKEFDKAIADCDRAIQLKPKTVIAYNYRAWAWLCLKEFDKAVTDCDRAIQIKPEDAVAYNYRSDAWLGLKRYPEALRDAHQAVRLKPDLASAYYNRARALLQLDHYADALKDCDRAIEQNPALYNQYYIRGRSHDGLQHYPEAIADYTRLIELQPRAWNAYHNRGVAFMSTGDYEQGLADLQKSCALEPQELIHPLTLQWCQLCLQPQITEEIRVHFTNLADLTDCYGLHRMYQGMDLWLKGAYLDALCQFELDITANPSYSDTSYFWSGMALAAMGRYDEAQEAVDHALQRGLPRFFLKTLALLPSEHSHFATHYLP